VPPLRPIDERLLQDAVAYIDRWVGYRQRTLAIPGIAIAVRFRDRVLLSRAYGMADLERGVPLTTDHVFRIASHSKTFTATAVMRLVERDALGLDDRVERWLPSLPSERGQIGRVTVRQLLSHAAGVIRDGEEGGFWQLERDFPDAGELDEMLRTTPPVFAQNERFKYSNIGYSLLGLLIERAAGEPYNRHVRREIVDRLGLTSTGPEIDDRARERLATGYTSDHHGLERLPLAHADTRAMSPATGFYSNAEDLCRYGAAHFMGNEELLTDDSKREMRRTHWRIEGVPHSYGLGLDVHTIGERVLVGHSGGFPGFVTNTLIDPADRLVLVALTNADDGAAFDLTAGMTAIVNRAMEAGPAPDERAQADLDRLCGRYWSMRTAVDVVRLGGQLLAVFPETPAFLDQSWELTRDGGAAPGELRIARAPGFASPGERARFAFDAGGGVQHVQLGATTYHPWETFESGVLASVRATGRAPRRDPRTLRPG
jgi:D-alanyl-D-alanine carboxypeptidase